MRPALALSHACFFEWEWGGERLRVVSEATTAAAGKGASTRTHMHTRQSYDNSDLKAQSAEKSPGAVGRNKKGVADLSAIQEALALTKEKDAAAGKTKTLSAAAQSAKASALVRAVSDSLREEVKTHRGRRKALYVPCQCAPRVVWL